MVSLSGGTIFSYNSLKLEPEEAVASTMNLKVPRPIVFVPTRKCCDTSRHRLVSQTKVKLRMREDCDSSRSRRNRVHFSSRSFSSLEVNNVRTGCDYVCMNRNVRLFRPRVALSVQCSHQIPLIDSIHQQLVKDGPGYEENHDSSMYRYFSFDTTSTGIPLYHRAVLQQSPQSVPATSAHTVSKIVVYGARLISDNTSHHFRQDVCLSALQSVTFWIMRGDTAPGAVPLFQPGTGVPLLPTLQPRGPLSQDMLSGLPRHPPWDPLSQDMLSGVPRHQPWGPLSQDMLSGVPRHQPRGPLSQDMLSGVPRHQPRGSSLITALYALKRVCFQRPLGLRPVSHLTASDTYDGNGGCGRPALTAVYLYVMSSLLAPRCLLLVLLPSLCCAALFGRPHIIFIVADDMISAFYDTTTAELQEFTVSAIIITIYWTAVDGEIGGPNPGQIY
uniref:Uncharacterized protein n=1 Tax=Timema tahoe TaxID=61484 RepID=A0A7R9NZK4_9NEOP|nr:unnamed protein product [Timema tahoe]